MSFIFELIILLSLIYLIYQCCIKSRGSQRVRGYLNRNSQSVGLSGRGRNNNRNNSRNNSRGNRRLQGSEDLERFRRERRASGRDGRDGGGGRGGGNAREPRDGRDGVGGTEVTLDRTGNVTVDPNGRTDLIKKNLFRRKINREESVEELSRLLAVSRGGASAELLEGEGAYGDGFLDEEMGRAVALSMEGGYPSNGANGVTGANGATDANGSSCAPVGGGLEGAPVSSNGSSSTNENGAPSIDKSVPVSDIGDIPAVPTADTLPADDSFPEPTAPNSSTANTTNGNAEGDETTMGVIRNIFTNWVQPNTEAATTNGVDEANQNKSCKSNIPSNTPMECSICLEDFMPNDTISWAKDGGDPPTNGSSFSNPNVGCDHIFHEECLIAWLQHHDECPLCRRKVVHADAEVRFAGWEGG